MELVGSWFFSMVLGGSGFFSMVLGGSLVFFLVIPIFFLVAFGCF